MPFSTSHTNKSSMVPALGSGGGDDGDDGDSGSSAEGGGKRTTEL